MDKELTKKQVSFLDALLTEPTITKAIQKAGISRNSAYAWLKDESFKTELKRCRMEVLDECVQYARQHFQSALEALVEIVEDGDTPMQVRINAVDSLFRNAKNASDFADEERLDELEKKLNALENVLDEMQ